MEYEKLKTFAITGVEHGSIVDAYSQEEAEKIFKEAWNDETIIHVKESLFPSSCY